MFISEPGMRVGQEYQAEVPELQGKNIFFLSFASPGTPSRGQTLWSAAAAPACL